MKHKRASICKNCFHVIKDKKFYCMVEQYETKPRSTCGKFLDAIEWNERIKNFSLEHQIED